MTSRTVLVADESALLDFLIGCAASALGEAGRLDPADGDAEREAELDGRSPCRVINAATAPSPSS